MAHDEHLRGVLASAFALRERQDRLAKVAMEIYVRIAPGPVEGVGDGMADAEEVCGETANWAIKAAEVLCRRLDTRELLALADLRRWAARGEDGKE